MAKKKGVSPVVGLVIALNSMSVSAEELSTRGTVGQLNKSEDISWLENVLDSDEIESSVFSKDHSRTHSRDYSRST